MSQPDVVHQWLDLPHQALVDQVHQLVRSHDKDAHRNWTMMREHPVLAARVRGILSALERHTAEYRDAALWRIWITQARNALTPPPPSAPSQPTPPTPDTNTADQEHLSGLPEATSPHPASPPPVIFRAPGQ